MIRYKLDILLELKKNGYNTGKIRREKLISERQLQDFRNKKATIAGINKICELTGLQPSDILEWVPDEE